MIDVLISVACYNNENEIIEFAKNLRKQTIVNRIKLVITCNSCSNYEFFQTEIKKVYPFCEIFKPDKNLGYINGCLNGFRNQKECYKYGVISNTDIDFVQEDFFEKIFNGKDVDVWCVAPDVIVPQIKIHSNPYRKHRPSFYGKKIRDFIFSHYFTYLIYLSLYRLKRKSKQNKENVSTSGYIYAAHGCCFILRKDCIEALLYENNQIFMYDEEFFVAEVIYKNKKKCFYDNTFVVEHNENQTTGKINYKAKQKWFKQSIIYLKKFFG